MAHAELKWEKNVLFAIFSGIMNPLGTLM